ncbi:MAG: macro domain-containing protein [Pseudomonadota bacterium]
MKTRTGDLLELVLQGEFDVIVHGCNCFHIMGAGIARQIAMRFPEAYEADKKTPHGDRNKLGTISTAEIERDNACFVIVNAYTQFDVRGRGPKVDYDAVSSCFAVVADRFAGRRIGYPLIGAGLAGGDWDLIAERISKRLEGLEHTLVTLLE